MQFVTGLCSESYNPVGLCGSVPEGQSRRLPPGRWTCVRARHHAGGPLVLLLLGRYFFRDPYKPITLLKSMSLGRYCKENADDGSTKPIKLPLLAFIKAVTAGRVSVSAGSDPHFGT